MYTLKPHDIILFMSEGFCHNIMRLVLVYVVPTLGISEGKERNSFRNTAPFVS